MSGNSNTILIKQCQTNTNQINPFFNLIIKSTKHGRSTIKRTKKNADNQNKQTFQGRYYRSKIEFLPYLLKNYVKYH